MTIKISTVRQKIAAQIATIPGFHQPKLPPEYLGRITDTIAHKAFGVEVNQVVNVPDVIKKVLASYQSLAVGLVPKFTTARHTIPNSLEYIIHELTFSVLHTIPGA